MMNRAAFEVSVSVSADGANPADVSRTVSSLDWLCVAYLGLPVLLFFFTWLRLDAGGALALLFVVGCAVSLRGSTGARKGLTRGQWLVVAAVAVTWAMLGGAGHIFYANYFDWHVRDAVLLDLTRHNGPFALRTVDDALLLFRSPLAYYLVPAYLARAMGEVVCAQFLLLVWTAIGVAFFFAHVLVRARSVRDVIAMLVVVVAFSGMDWVGGIVAGRPQPLLSTEHLQWWATLFQYSSNTTLLFWVPNHALPGWFLAAFLYARWSDPRGVRMVPFWLAVLPLWSPLTAIGGIPLLLAFVWRHRSARRDLIAMVWAGALFFLPALVCSAYLVLDAASVPGSRGESIFNVLFVRHYAMFVVLQFGLLWICLWRMRADALLAVAGAVLLALPLFRFGPNNDLVMRASIAPLMVVCLAAVDRLCALDWSVKAARDQGMTIVVLLALGAITPAHEIARSLLEPRWTASTTTTAYIETLGAPHYFARFKGSLFERLLAEPIILPAPAVLPKQNIRMP